MLRSLIAALLALSIGAAHAADNNVGAQTRIFTFSSGNVANAAATATFPAKPGVLNLLCGFSFTSTGSTAAQVVLMTITGLNGGTATYVYASQAGVTLNNPVLTEDFTPCVPATGPNVAIVVSMPALGSGNTNAALTAMGYGAPFP
jgi:hypothetical protein